MGTAQVPPNAPVAALDRVIAELQALRAHLAPPPVQEMVRDGPIHDCIDAGCTLRWPLPVGCGFHLHRIGCWIHTQDGWCDCDRGERLARKQTWGAVR